MHSIPAWHEIAEELIDVAVGRKPADLVVRNAAWVNVHSREVLKNSDIAVSNGRFAYCGADAGHCVGADTVIVEADGMYAVPGLCDGHMHIESGMLTPARFAEAVIPHGTTTLFADPHEIANVLGLQGVRLMHDEALLQPINIFMQMPSCIPSAPGLETPGATIRVEDVEEAMRWPGIIGLGEMMNFPGIVSGDGHLLAEIAAARAAGKTVGGHYASPDLGADFHAYAAGGPADDHEGTREADAVMRIRQGMRCMMRLGSAWYDVEKQITAVTEKGLDPRGFILCTDDCHPGTLVGEGHMDRVVRHAVTCGCEPLVALQMATLNSAAHFGLEREIGSIAPGRRADFILSSCLRTLPVEAVYARGRHLAENGGLLVATTHGDWPEHALRMVNLKRDLVADDFCIKAPGNTGEVAVKVIGVVENQAPTKHLQTTLAIRDGRVEGCRERDICQIALVERHRGTGGVINAFVSGFGYTGRMALASTIAHDSHHMIVVGTDREQMALAANRLAAVHGGMTIWRDGGELALVELPVAGLMSQRRARDVAAEAGRLSAAMAECGCQLNNALMQHSLLALPVIPELRISDLGLVDAVDFRLTSLFSEI
ncbi:MAG: adenine deaminase [Rhodobacteraceae bacterium]|nr:adenine deaminase [Paracoccaceae bacterium]